MQSPSTGRRQSPGPPASLITGHLTAFRRNPLEFLTHCAQEYGDFVRLRFGYVNALLLNNPYAIEEVLVTQQACFRKNARELRPLCGGGLLVSDGAQWHRQRDLVSPIFERLEPLANLIVVSAERRLTAWRDGEVRDIQQDMTGLALEIIAGALFNMDITPELAETAALLDDLQARIWGRLTNLHGVIPSFVPTPGNLSLARGERRLQELINAILLRRRGDNGLQRDLFSALAEAQSEDGRRMTDVEFSDEIRTILLSGREPALTLSWSLHLLGSHPQVEAALQVELQRVLGGRPPTAADLPQLHFTAMVVAETLRLYPPVWAMAREAVQDCSIAGHTIRQGMPVLMSQWVVQRDPRFFSEANTFKPKRWAGDLAQRLPRFAYFPFGGGPRACIGAAFTRLEATLALATIMQQFQLRPAPGADVIPAASLTLRPRHGVPMMVHRRRP